PGNFAQLLPIVDRYTDWTIIFRGQQVIERSNHQIVTITTNVQRCRLPAAASKCHAICDRVTYSRTAAFHRVLRARPRSPTDPMFTRLGWRPNLQGRGPSRPARIRRARNPGAGREYSARGRG